MKYICKLCNYESGDFSNYNRHNKSKKHLLKSNEDDKNIFDVSKNVSKCIQNVSKCIQPKSDNEAIIYKCDQCDKKYKYSQGLSKHKKNCKKEDVDALKSKINFLETQLYKQEKESLSKQINILEESNKTYKTIAINATDAVKTSAEASKTASEATKYSMSALNFLTKHFTDAPQALKFDKMELLTHDTKEKSVVELAILYYKSNNYTIHAFIGDVVIKEYKTKDPKQQSVWTSDPSRNNYILREKIESNELIVWNADKEGTRAAILMVDPILDHLKKEIIKYLKETIKLLNTDDQGDNDGEIRNKMLTASEIKSQIDSGILKSKIISYMGSHLYLNKKIVDCEK